MENTVYYIIYNTTCIVSKKSKIYKKYGHKKWLISTEKVTKKYLDNIIFITLVQLHKDIK